MLKEEVLGLPGLREVLEEHRPVLEVALMLQLLQLDLRGGLVEVPVEIP